MSQIIVDISNKLKTNNSWSIACEFVDHRITSGAWITKQKQLIGFNLDPDKVTNKSVILNLYANEKKEYRNNLNTDKPKLFVVLENEMNEQEKLLTITASKKVATFYIEKGYLVLSNDMPYDVIKWLKMYI